MQTINCFREILMTGIGKYGTIVALANRIQRLRAWQDEVI